MFLRVKNVICLLKGFTLITILSYNLSAQGNRPIASVKQHEGIPALFINDTLYPPFAYMSYLGETKYYKEATSSGIHLFNIPAYLGDRGINSSSGIGPFRKPIWVGKSKLDFSSIIHDFDEILEADPQAKVIIRLHLDPPIWWEKQHPESTVQLPDGSTLRTTFSSLTWKKETAKVFKSCLQWLLASRYSNHLIGIHVAGGFTEEWFYHFKDYFYDLNPVRTKAFQQWLRQKYKTNAALQQAWNSKSLTFETAQPADISGKEHRGEWRNPKQEQNFINTFQFHSETMADNIDYFCKIVKETSNRTLLTGAFYGYHYFVVDPRRGHGALTKLLNCTDLDYLSSPNDYNRVIGEDWAPMLAIRSVQQHGKLWLAENDTRTSITTLLKERAPHLDPERKYESSVWLGPKDMATSVSFLWKNLGRMLSYGYGGWWFDMWGGWFSDPQLLNVLEKGQQWYQQYPPTYNPKMKPQVSVIVDEQLGFWDASYGDLTNHILKNRYSLGKTGAPYDLFLRADFDSATTGFQVVWLMGLLQLTEKERLKIQELQQKGVLVLWTDGAGTYLYDNMQKGTYYKDKFSWSDQELRALWEKAGVHIYSDSGDVLYAGRNWLTIHTVDGGKRTIRLPFPAQIINPINGKQITTGTARFEVNLPAQSTTIYRIVTP